MLSLILWIASAVVFLLGAIPVSSRINLVSLGLLLATLAFLVERHLVV